ncbi:MAG: HEAT repeat domain-containing protein, partial [Chloroflexi bacterium]|nr:HEAT repeat domain-containing protein [Chloroflexota bacterium]
MPEQPDWKPLVQVLHSDTGEARAHAIPVLARYFNSSAQVRLEAAHLLATETHPRTRNALVDALRAEVSDKVVRDALIERVQRDSDPGVQRSAIQALSELLADAAVLDALIGATNDGDPSVRYEAAQALQAMSQDDRVGAVLEPLLRDDDPNVRGGFTVSATRWSSDAGVPMKKST